MDPMVMQVAMAGLVELVALPVMIFVLEKLIGARLDKFDHKRDEARFARAEADRKAIEQREAEHAMLLAIARTMLLNNYEKCMDKGYYSREEREIYSKMYAEYKLGNGNGVIDTIAERIRQLPLEPPNDDD